ncbi:hypothetical protein C9446_05015 [Providencia heimbachae]|nr:hypothetical protein C9446_05015 [Providencia heimbachae]
MGINDHEYVNFSEDYELNYHLEKWNKSKSIRNRITLRTMGDELKNKLQVYFVTHQQFDSYISTNLYRLDNPLL